MDSQSEFNNVQDNIESEEVYKKPKRQMNYETSLNSGPWSQEENFKYMVFIDKNRTNLTSKSKRRVGKVFKQMSSVLGTRNAIQCRSHHQKQLDKFKNISKIISIFRKDLNDEEYDKKIQQIDSVQFSQGLISSKSIVNEEKISKMCKNVQIQTEIAGIHLKLNVEESQQLKEKLQMQSKEFYHHLHLNNVFSIQNFQIGFPTFWPYYLLGKQNDY